jgi:hypothetical protein
MQPNRRGIGVNGRFQLQRSHRRRASVLAVLAGALIPAASPPADAASPYVVSNYPVDVSAADAVTAKAQGLEEARLGAFRYLLKRLVSVGAFRQLPRLASAAVEDLLDGVSVRSEQNSGTEYVATLDFTFRADKVRKLLTGSALPFLDQQAAMLTVIPMFATPAGTGTARGLSSAEGQKAWRQAWASLDLVHTLTPITLAAGGPSSSNDTILALAKGDRSKLGIVQSESSADKLLVAIATPTADGRHLSMTLIGSDWVGPVDFRREFTMYYGDPGYTAEYASVVALGILEGRWKESRGLQSASTSEAVAAGWSTDPGRGVEGGQTVRFTVEFNTILQWQQIRGRLSAALGPQAMQIGAISARGAEVTTAFPGGAEALQRRLAPEGLLLASAGDHLVLRAAN